MKREVDEFIKQLDTIDLTGNKFLEVMEKAEELDDASSFEVHFPVQFIFYSIYSTFYLVLVSGMLETASFNERTTRIGILSSFTHVC